MSIKNKVATIIYLALSVVFYVAYVILVNVNIHDSTDFVMRYVIVFAISVLPSYVFLLVYILKYHEKKSSKILLILSPIMFTWYGAIGSLIYAKDFSSSHWNYWVINVAAFVLSIVMIKSIKAGMQEKKLTIAYSSCIAVMACFDIVLSAFTDMGDFSGLYEKSFLCVGEESTLGGWCKGLSVALFALAYVSFVMNNSIVENTRQAASQRMINGAQPNTYQPYQNMQQRANQNNMVNMNQGYSAQPVVNSQPAANFDYINELKEIKKLFDTGVITENEFEAMKQNVINNRKN